MPGHPAILALLLLAAISLYGFSGLSRLLKNRTSNTRKRLFISAYWLLDVLFIVFSVAWLIYIRGKDVAEYELYRLHFYLTALFVLVFMPKLFFALFVLLHDLKNLLAGFIVRIQRLSGFYPDHLQKFRKAQGLLIAGVFVAGIVFLWVVHGLTLGRHQFRIEKVEIVFADLPPSFDGYTIVHFSDTHLGSFSGKRPVVRGLRKIKNLEADVIFFTGDLINNQPEEAAPFIEHFYRVQAPHGKYAVLGNHDLGDYRTWSTIDETDPEEQKIERLHKEMGFNLLRNEHDFIRKGNDSIMVAGVDNWGLDPFMKLGDLDKALGEHSGFPFQIILTHDPTHWREEILPQTSIQLTLSGHTHGMQMGIHTRFFSWSPAAWIYPEWNGLYREDDQKIYVNRGFGYLSLPGRIGMPPEITLIVLKRKHDPCHNYLVSPGSPAQR